MKKILLLLLAFLLISCGNEGEKDGIIKESWDIIEWYIDTLETTPGEAREVKNLIESRNDSLQDSILYR